MDTELHNSVDCICGAMTAELYNSKRLFWGHKS